MFMRAGFIVGQSGIMHALFCTQPIMVASFGFEMPEGDPTVTW